MSPPPRGAPASVFLIGLTGPIGCGKSTVARHLAGLGGRLVDADALAREVTVPGSPALAAIRERFGPGVMAVDGSLDRAALAAIVFSDAAALRDLEAIVHPGVRRLVEEALDRAASDGAIFCLLEAIKLVEGGLAERCDEVWLITCGPEAQRARLHGRGLAGDDIERRLATQGPDLAAQLAERADRIIDTSGTQEEVFERAEDALADALAGVLGSLPPLGGARRTS